MCKSRETAIQTIKIKCMYVGYYERNRKVGTHLEMCWSNKTDNTTYIIWTN